LNLQHIAEIVNLYRTRRNVGDVLFPVETYHRIEPCNWPIFVVERLISFGMCTNVVVDTHPNQAAAWRLTLKRYEMTDGVTLIVSTPQQPTVLPFADVLVTYRRFMEGPNITWRLSKTYPSNVHHLRPPVDARAIMDSRVDPSSWMLNHAVYSGMSMYVTVAGTEFGVSKDERALIHANTTACTICLEDITPPQVAILRPCRHVFHPTCIDEWLSYHSQDNTCPFCRSHVAISVKDVPIHIHTAQVAEIYRAYTYTMVQKALFHPTNVMVVCQTRQTLCKLMELPLQTIQAYEQHPNVIPNVHILQTPQWPYQTVWPTTVFLCDGIDYTHVSGFIKGHIFKRYKSQTIAINQITVTF
jgi:hypothetical protein